MERTNRELNGKPAATSFLKLTDPATGQSFAVEDMTDEQLVRFSGLAAEQCVGVKAGLLAAIDAYTQGQAISAVIRYEIERRQVKLQIVPKV